MEQSLAALQHRHGPRYRWLATLTVMTGTMAMAMSATIANVALPAIQEDYRVGHAALQWVSTGFLVAVTVGMLVNAWLVDRVGVRRAYLGALLLFLLASLAATLPLGFAGLVACRVGQGLSAGIVQPLALLLIYQVFEARERGAAIGLYGMGVILAPTLGPLLGGVLVDWVGWRSIFLMAVPVVLAALPMAWHWLPRPERLLRRRLDLIGLLLLSAGITLLFGGLTHGSRLGWWSGPVQGALAAGVALLCLFAWVEARIRSPLLQLEVFRHAGFVGAFLLALLTGAGLFSLVYIMPLQVQTLSGFSSSLAGLLMVPSGLAMALAYPVIGRMADRYDVLILVMVGLALSLLASVALGILVDSRAFLTLAGWAIVSRIGIALLMPPVVLGALRLLPDTLLNQGTGVISFARQMGGAMGVVLVSVILQERTPIFPGGELMHTARAYRDAYLVYALLFAIGLWPAWVMARASRTRG